MERRINKIIKYLDFLAVTSGANIKIEGTHILKQKIGIWTTVEWLKVFI